MSSDAWSLNPVREKQGSRFLVALLCAVSFMALIAYTHKAAEDRSAFVRWRYQVIQLMENGRNIYDREMYPNPPVMPITLYPLMMLPPLLGAVAFFVINHDRQNGTRAKLADLKMVLFCSRHHEFKANSKRPSARQYQYSDPLHGGPCSGRMDTRS